MANKRIIEQTASTTISNDDWLIKDSPTDGTTKIQASVFKTLMNDGMASDEDLADAIENIAGEYDSEVEYSKDALCFKDGVLYIANADTTGTWDSTKWNATTIADIIANLRIDANDVVDVKVKGDSLVNPSKIAVLDSLTAQGSASGSIASFSDGSTHPMSKLEVAIDPIQDLHGYDSPWVGGAGKNKLNANNKTISEGDYVVNNVPIVLSAGTYTFSFDFSGNGVGSAASFRIDDSNGMAIFTANKTVVNGKNTIQITLTSDGSFVKYYSNAVGSYSNLMIEAGSTASSFAPYSNICPISGFTEANVTRCGKNIATTEIYKNNYVLAVDGTENYASGFIITKEIKINSSNNYYISMVGGQTSSSDAIRVGYYDGNFNFIARESEYSPSLLRMHDNAEYIRLSYRNIDPYFKDIQIEVGTEATAYEPYNGNTYKVEFKDGSNPLTVYGGTLDVVSGELTVDRVSLSLNSIENFSSDSVNADGYIRYNCGIVGKAQNFNILCDKIKVIQSIVQVDAHEELISGRNNNDKLYFTINSTRLSGDLSTSTGRSNALKTLLATNDIQVVYELATPQTYQLTPTQVRSLLGTNNVWADTGDVNEAIYTRDLNTTINDIISRIEALENA